MNPTTSAQALSSLQQTQAQAQDPNTILANQQQQLGVNAAQNTVQGLRGAIDNTTQLLTKVAPSVMGRTGNSLVTNAQATRQIGNEQAPIQQNLATDTNKYNEANTNLNDLQSKASQAAQGIYQGQQDKLSYAQNLYNTLYKQEQDAATAAENQREFNQSLAAKSSSNSAGGISDVLGSLLGGNSTPGGAQIQQRTNGGFNFQDAKGQATNAVGFSQAKGVPIRTLLSQMAQAGDNGAKTALNYVGNDYGVNTQKLGQLRTAGPAYASTISLLHALGFRV